MDGDRDDAGDGTRWLSYSELATARGISKASATRLAFRKGWPRRTGNDRQARVAVPPAAQVPSSDDTPVIIHDIIRDDTPDAMDGDTMADAAATGAAVAVLVAVVAELRADLGQARSALDVAVADRLADHGRAERAEAQTAAEAARATLAEARLASTEAALVEARQPWIVRVIRAVRPRR